MREFGLWLRTLLAASVLCGIYLGVVLLAYSLLAAVRITTVLGDVGALAVVVCVTLGAMFLQYRLGVRRTVTDLDARPLSQSACPDLHAAADELSDAVGVGRPDLYVARMDTPNALALGSRRGGRVFFSESLLERLDADERRAILAHELVHLRYHDTVVQSLAHSLVRTVGALTWVLFAMLGAFAWAVGKLVGAERNVPGRERSVDLNETAVAAATMLMVVLTVVTRTLSRQREAVADRAAARATGDPAALASALRTIAAGTGPTSPREAPPSLYVVGVADAMLGPLFYTHPPVERRVDRLLETVGPDHDDADADGLPDVD
jgi:heat shock protein HtpX